MTDRRELALLQAALQVFWERGYQATSFDDLTHAGLNRRAIYSRYGSKMGLFEAVLEWYRRDRLDFMRTNLEGGDLASLIRFMETLEQLVATEFDGRGCLVANAGCEMSHAHDNMRVTFADHFGAMHDLMHEALTNATRADALDIDVDALAAELTAMVVGSLHFARTGDRRTIATQAMSGAANRLRALSPAN
jgi:TetR/AcrR family transcriptional repressor of nem operon